MAFGIRKNVIIYVYGREYTCHIYLRTFKTHHPDLILDPLFHKAVGCQRDNCYCISWSDQFAARPRFMVVNLLLGIEKVSVLRQGWSILKDTNSAAS